MVNRLLGGVGRSLIFAGVVLLLFVGYQLWGTKLDEEQHQADLTRELGRNVGLDKKSTSESADSAVIAQKITTKLADIDPSTAAATPAPKEGDAGGFIEIPKIGLRSKTFVEGVSKADLRKGPGHYPGTPMPGNAGNAAIAGHRTTYGAPFNRIDELAPGDDIITYTPQGKFVYEVMDSPVERRRGDHSNWSAGWFAVNPNDVSVLAPTTDNRLTLTACHPKYSAQLRIIVQAKLIAQPAESPPTTVAPKVTKPAPNNEPTKDMIAGDPGELAPALMFLGLVVVVWLASMGIAALLRRREWRAWPIYVVAIAASAPFLWFGFVHMDRFLPSF